MPIPTNRTTSNTPTEHVSDHNLLHAFYNSFEGFTPASFAGLPHNHSAAEITSGTISAARLGAGTSSVTTNVLRGGSPTGTWAALNLSELGDFDASGTNAPNDVLTRNGSGGYLWQPLPTGSGGSGSSSPKGHHLFVADSTTTITPSLYDAAWPGDGGSGDIVGPRAPVVNLNSTTTVESSGMAISAQRTASSMPVMYLNNDSGDTYPTTSPNPAATQPAPLPGGYTAKTGSRARFHAMNMSNGTRIRSYVLRNAANTTYHANIDFESMGYVLIGGTYYLFLYDTNNTASGGDPGPYSFLYRCVEPDPATGTDQTDIISTRIRCSWTGINGGNGRYSEGMFVDTDGFLYLFRTATNIAETTPGLNPADVYKSSAAVHTAADDSTITFTVVGNVNVRRVDDSTTASEWIGACDIAPDRSCFLVHTYASVGGTYDRILLFDLPSAGTTIATALAAGPRRATNDGTGRDVQAESQGEATAILPGSNGYVRISEGSSRPIRIFDVNPVGGGGSETYPITSADEDFIILCRCTAGANGTLTLPSPATGPKRVWVKRLDDFNLQTMQIDPNGHNLDGEDAQQFFLTNGQCIGIYNTGSEYMIFADQGALM